MPISRPIQDTTGSILDIVRLAKERHKWVWLTLTARCEPREVHGLVTEIPPTNAYVIVGGIHVPLEDIESAWLK